MNSRTAIQLRSGVFFDPFNIDPAMIKIEDVAHSLANIPRFGGHLGERWSVAHHSLLVMQLTPDPHKLCAELHDGPDMVVGDLPAPIKYHPMLDGFRTLELDLKRAFAAVFGIPFPYPECVRHFDLIARYAEAKTMHHGTEWWAEGPAPEDKDEIELACRLIPEILALPDIKRTFLTSYKVLTGVDVHA